MEEKRATGAKVSEKSIAVALSVTLRYKTCLPPRDFTACVALGLPDEFGGDDGGAGGTDERGSMVNTLKSSRMAVNSAAAASAQMLCSSLDIASRQVWGSLVIDLTGSMASRGGRRVCGDEGDEGAVVLVVGRLLSRCGLTVRAEVWAVHVRWAKASRGL
ncbi:BZ3500_MvSof-1268-A1-R1_C063g00294 [Microbotryum saponariae]|uniref:BZ3500_MvSof-1268-A1-R1_C063g00294 protein n=1 Tax=Microbotryum saponariae TaxID=289078 RepID=A0A2X0KNC3_9BASI|nr:BZ3500_MvSof-1268-A1-R1_C063g00294 [Microbotryum saponariae]